MKRVLLIDQSPNLGGTVFGMHELVRALDRRRYEPLVAFCQPHRMEERFRALGVEVLHLLDGTPPHRHISKPRDDASHGLVRDLTTISRYELACARGVSRLIREHGIGLVHHNNHLLRDRLGVIAAAIRGVPQVCHIHNLSVPTPVARIASRFVDRFIYMTRAIERVYRGVGIAAGRGTVIYDPIDSSPAPEEGDARQLRTELGIDAGDFVVTNAGRIDTWKGHDIFVRAIAALLPRIPAMKALIVGEVSDTAHAVGYDTMLRTLIDDLGIGNRVLFTGFRDDVPRIMAASDVVVHSATQPEPFGRVIAEGLMAARPVIATTAGGVPEIIDDGVTGILVPCSDATALAEALAWIHSHRVESQAMAKAGRQTAMQRFGVERFAAEIVAVYDGVMERRGDH